MQKHRSNIQAKLVDNIKKIFPNYRVLEEYPIGENLYLDIYLPDFACGIELHGKQHYEFSPFFHATAEAWEDQKRRDKKKASICEREGITLIVFKYDEPINDCEYIENKILDSLA